jgi:O-antigen/teichoic acid export membrane protein
MSTAFEKFKSIRQHWLARSFSWLFIGQGLSIVLQAASFILLARLLGVKEYGVFAGAFALVSIVTPYSALGSNLLFMRYVSVDRSQAGTYWGNGILITGAATLLLAVGLSIWGPAITNLHSRIIFIVLVVANCFFFQVAAIASAVFQTFEKMRATATLSLLTNLARLLILIAMKAFMSHATALQWSYAVLLASGGAAVASFIWVGREIGAPGFNAKLAFRRLGEGVGFSVAGATQSIYNDVDKTMLSHYGLTRENGFYTLAYRVISVATTPITAIDASVMPRYFQMGRAKMNEIVRLAWKSAGLAVGVGVLIVAAVYVGAPLVPHLVGKDFSGVVAALHWLCWVPLLRSIHQMSGSALTGSGFQNRRTFTQFAVAGVNFLLNLWWIPTYGWIGAAWSSVASDGLLAILNTILLIWTWRQVVRQNAAQDLQEECRKI